MDKWGVIAGLGQGALGFGGAVWAIVYFVKWMCEFIAKRQDARDARLTVRENELQARYDLRLSHVEKELELYRTATMRLVNRVAVLLPNDPVLGEVASILRAVIPADSDTPDDMLATLAKVKRADE